MALISCAECKAQISDKAIGCPQCGAPVLRPPANQLPIDGRGNGLTKLVLWLVGGITVLAIIGANVQKPADAPKLSPEEQAAANVEKLRQERCGGDFYARVMAEHFVKKNLKSPSTAKFTDTRAVSSGDCKFNAGGFVDSQNSFGAMLRSQYSLQLTFDPQTDSWTASAIHID